MALLRPVQRLSESIELHLLIPDLLSQPLYLNLGLLSVIVVLSFCIVLLLIKLKVLLVSIGEAALDLENLRP